MTKVPSLSILATAVLSLSACQQSSDPARAAALKRIEERLTAQEVWVQRHGKEYSALKKRYKAGEEVEQQLKALKATEPQFRDLQDEAWTIVEADPSDDAAFTALGIIQKANFSQENRSKLDTPTFQAQQARLARILLDSHLKREDFLSVRYVYLSDAEARIAYWEEVYRGSPHRPVRAEAAYRLADQYFAEAGEPDLTPAAREDLRRQVLHYAEIIRRDYADMTDLTKAADRYVAGLDHSVGVVLPVVEAETINGGKDALANYRGKVVLLDFWATWCGACRKDHPRLIALSHELDHRPFEIISVSADENPELVSEYIAKVHQLPWPQWYVGPEGPVLKQWGIQGYPTYLLLDRDGKLQARGNTQSLDAMMDQARGLVAQPSSESSLH